MEEQNIVEKKKNNTGLVIIIITLGLICLGLGGFIFINKDKLFGSNDSIEEQVESIKEELSINDKLVQKLYKMTQSEYDTCGYANEPLLIENVGDKLNSSTMSDAYKGKIILDYLAKEKEISEENMKIAYEKVFGPSTYKVMNTVHLDVLGNINYDSTNKKYVLDFDLSKPWGCVTHQYNQEKIIDIKEENDSVKIITAYIFNGNFSTYLYKDAKEKESLEESMSISSDKEKALEYIENHKDELHQLTYTFIKSSDGNYYYSEVERTK